ncbi:hypothetical protein [Dyella subtropica]|uniref:hypothetical protein n=1 Tax=Dyella subtropica TaxID=2992127 RepID=UPI00225B0F9D|nr:hypothetical protein [Dyella subtropica]
MSRSSSDQGGIIRANALASHQKKSYLCRPDTQVTFLSSAIGIVAAINRSCGFRAEIANDTLMTDQLWMSRHSYSAGCLIHTQSTLQAIFSM